MSSALAVLVAIVFAGCSGSGDESGTSNATAGGEAEAANLAGTYVLDRDAMKAQVQTRIEATEDPQTITNLQMTQGAIDAMEMVLTLHEDGTLSGDSVTLGRQFTLGGTWRVNGDSITIEMSANDQEPKPYPGQLTGDRIRLEPSSETAAYGIVLQPQGTTSP